MSSLLEFSVLVVDSRLVPGVVGFRGRRCSCRGCRCRCCWLVRNGIPPAELQKHPQSLAWCKPPSKNEKRDIFFIGMAPRYRLSKFASQRLEISWGHTFLLCRLLPDTIAEPRMRCSRPREVLLQKFIKVNWGKLSLLSHPLDLTFGV